MDTSTRRADLDTPQVRPPHPLVYVRFEAPTTSPGTTGNNHGTIFVHGPLKKHSIILATVELFVHVPLNRQITILARSAHTTNNPENQVLLPQHKYDAGRTVFRRGGSSSGSPTPERCPDYNRNHSPEWACSSHPSANHATNRFALGPGPRRHIATRLVDDHDAESHRSQAAQLTVQSISPAMAHTIASVHTLQAYHNALAPQ